MRAKVLIVAVPLLLTACQVKVDTDDKNASVSVGDDGNVTVKPANGAGLSVSVPGFQAKVDIPGLQMGGKDMDIDGIKLYPGTKLDAINVNGQDHDGGVDMRFTSTVAPAAIAQYYADAARQHDFTNVAVTNTNGVATLNASKPDGDKLAIAMNPDGRGGTTGHIQVIDSK